MSIKCYVFLPMRETIAVFKYGGDPFRLPIEDEAKAKAICLAMV